MGKSEIGKRTQFLKWSFAVALVGMGFVAGWISQTKLRFLNEAVVEASVIASHGDSPVDTREQIMGSMRIFQGGYADRDVRQLEPFMQRLFPREGEILFLGTESDEWIHGYEDVGKIIRHDWVDWNDVRLDLSDCQVSSAGDVAWVATRGEVSSATAKRPLRFSATLARVNGVWKFRQLQFQYSDRFVSLRDFLHPAQYSNIHWN
ncbi:MAG TPA: nuclear transport factor 2 family protein [Candidatus Acidoferrum sp.]|nr:nuclear transport factor 2 family protein [Candidatus Acidoferrum sp.]